ncbi:hypothetical protein B9Z55_018808 [Caenorhabditis nigoni]|uniref:Uncharacterized protein n=1 Tax=Caenorhabditis nigoni TaxID=1611254 RepID=A0A2G5TFR1_9PELO|nr:hypothetical protein B9Z55_018808 [Caenorhabditis nigoni]
MVTTKRIFSVFLFVPLFIFIPSDACAPTSAVSDPVTSTTEASTTESTTTEADTTTMMDTSTDSSSTTEVPTTTAMEEISKAFFSYNSITSNGVTTASMTVTCSSTDPADYVRMHFDPTQTPHENSNNGGFPSSVTVELTCSSDTNTWTYLKIDVGVLTVDGVTCTQTPR